MRYMMPSQIPLVLHLFGTDFAMQLPAHCVHIQDMLKFSNIFILTSKGERLSYFCRFFAIPHLLQVEFVAEHPLAVLTHPRLPALPGGTQEGGHLGKDQLSALAMWNLSCDG